MGLLIYMGNKLEFVSKPNQIYLYEIFKHLWKQNDTKLKKK